MLGNIKFRRDAQQFARGLGFREDRSFAVEKDPEYYQSSDPMAVLLSRSCLCQGMCGDARCPVVGCRWVWGHEMLCRGVQVPCGGVQASCCTGTVRTTPSESIL